MLFGWAFLVQVLAVRAFAGGMLPPSAEVVITPCRIDINHASVSELQALPSMGPVRAEALVLERIRNGLFVGLDDLARVHGMGPELLEELADFVCFDS